MPSLILTGYPSAGKSTLANMIRERALQHPSGLIERVIIVNEEIACPSITSSGSSLPTHNKNTQFHSTNTNGIGSYYSTAHMEKTTRAGLKAAFDRAIAQPTTSAGSTKTSTRNTTLVILDSLNYIKGFRYELYCISKTAQDRHAIIWVRNDVPLAKQWNRMRRNGTATSDTTTSSTSTSTSTSSYYSDELMDELIQRYEPPDTRNRWDRPLYEVDMRPKEFFMVDEDEEKRRNNLSLTSLDMATNVPQEQATNTMKEDHGHARKSVYNMHDYHHRYSNVKGVSMSDRQIPTTTMKEEVNHEGERAGTPIGSSAAVPLMQPSSNTTFKRIGFKRVNNNSNTSHVVSSQVVANTDTSTATSTSKTTSEATSPASLATNNGCVTTNTATAITPASPHPQNTFKAIYISLEDRVDQILDSFLTDVKPLEEGTSTRQQISHGSDVLHSMDMITQQICAAIESTQQQSKQARNISSNHTQISNPSGDGPIQQIRVLFQDLTVTLDIPSRGSSQYLALPSTELRRLRKEYIRWVASYPPKDSYSPQSIMESFLTYLEEAATSVVQQQQRQQHKKIGEGTA